MTKLRATLGFICAISLSGIASLSHAATCDEALRPLLDAQGRPTSALVYLITGRGCLGSESDGDALAIEANKQLAGAKPADERAQKVLARLLQVIGTPELPLAPDAASREAKQQIEKAVHATATGTAPGNAPVAIVDWDWSPAAGVNAVPALRLVDDLAARCQANAPVDDCKAAVKSANAWLRLFGLTQRALGVYSQAYFDAVQKYAVTRLKKWHAYRDEGLPQYPWEYALNSYVMRHNDKRPRVNNNPVGHEAIPTSQYIFLHPGASLEWRDASADNVDSSTKPALYVELFGINRWSFDEDTGAMLGSKGISIIASYTNRDGRESTGYGLLFHSRLTKQFTFGITRAGDETVYLVNVDFAEYFKEKLGYWKAIGQKIETEKAAASP